MSLNFLGNKKPKYKLQFSINEIANIPHTSGSCFVELEISDGSPSSIRATISHFRPFLSQQKDSSDNESVSDAASNSKNATLAHSSSRSIHVRTSENKIHNFRCHFNFSMSCNLRFPLKRKDNMIGDKWLSLKVLYKADKSSRSTETLGVVKINLAEYLNFSQPKTVKYLLQDSKINSILNLTTSLEELPADFEFRTQLRIDDTKRTNSASQSTLVSNKSANRNTKQFKVPEFQGKAVFGGLDGVINPQQKSDALAKPESLRKPSTEEDEAVPQEDRQTAEVGGKTFDDVIVDPIIGSLYRKVLESTWDPELHSLLKITPQKIVDDIFKLADDPKQLELDLDNYHKLSSGLGDDSFRNSNGLIAESRFRNNLKSWTVSET